MTARGRVKKHAPSVERLYSLVLLTVTVFGSATADTRSRPSHGKVENGKRHIRQHGTLVYVVLKGDCLKRKAFGLWES